jgi:hypothetical protein
MALGTAVFAGMIGVTFFGIFFTPVFFLCNHQDFYPSFREAAAKLNRASRTEGKSSSLIRSIATPAVWTTIAATATRKHPASRILLSS